MKKNRIIFLLITALVVCLIILFNLDKLTKNKIKHFVLHNVGLLDSEWEITTEKKDDHYTISLNSPSLLIDDVYISMEGPYTYKRFMLNPQEDQIYWIRGFEAQANSNLDIETSSNDFVCHVNFYHSPEEHFSRMGLENRIGMQSPQLITLTTGSLSLDFPKGFAYPIFSNEKILVGSQALNLNEQNEWFNLDYNFLIHYSKNPIEKLKPLYMKYLVMALPYESETQNKKELSQYQIPDFVQCAGPSSKTMYKSQDEYGQSTTAFWEVPVGQHTYVNDISTIIDVKIPETIHYINAHVHPFATSLELFDATLNKTIFKSDITNKIESKSISNITSFSSETGIKVYPNHKYELILEVNNLSDEPVDMMASLFVYFFDQELNEKLKSEAF